MLRIHFAIAAWLLLHPAAAAFAENPYVQFTTTLGDFTVELCSEISARCAGDAPLTVTHFLTYVDGDRYPATTIIDRRNSGALPPLLQGGGLYSGSDEQGPYIDYIPATTVVARELDEDLSNLRGSLAMVYEPGLMGSAGWWLVNLADNPSQDTADGGYAVFGQVARGMAVVDAIGRVPVYDFLFGDLPLVDYPGNDASVIPYLVFVTSTERVPEPGATGLAAAALLVLATRARRGYPARP